MKQLENIFEDISIQLKEEKSNYKKLKICKYSFEISKICILSLSTGLSFINAFAIISLIFIPNVVMNLIAKNCIYEKIKLSKEDELRYLKKLDNGYIKSIHFLENNVKIYNDKFNINRQDLYLNNVRNGDLIFIYGILDANKTGLNYDIPSVKFNEPYLLIDNVRFENPIPNDISAYKLLKSKSMYSNNFIINYDDYINYYRIYFWNISRQILHDNANKFINILTIMEESACEVDIVFKTSASITLKYSKNDKLIVYKSQ